MAERRRDRRPAGALLALTVVACGGGGGGPDAMAPDDEVCTPAAGDGPRFDPTEAFCRRLSSYGFFGGDAAAHQPRPGVVPYELNSALFSDYTEKYRFVWLPEGTAMAYDPTDAFDFPVGAVILKTFAYPHDLRDPAGPRRLLETRLLAHRPTGWDAVSYVWNEDQTEARLAIAGDILPSTFVDLHGNARENTYIVPNKNECGSCHEEREGTLAPVGPKARHVNRDFDHGQGPVNQLAHLAAVGYLTGAPDDPEEAPRLPAWDDAAAGSLDARARAWLEINCAHCHNPEGAARTSGLDLLAAQDEPFRWGVCKPPVAAGMGSGGLQYSIVPGDPDASILVFRLESTNPAIQMPELGRRLVHEESVALIRAWIAGMEGGCGP